MKTRASALEQDLTRVELVFYTNVFGQRLPTFSAMIYRFYRTRYRMSEYSYYYGSKRIMIKFTDEWGGCQGAHILTQIFPESTSALWEIVACGVCSSSTSWPFSSFAICSTSSWFILKYLQTADFVPPPPPPTCSAQLYMSTVLIPDTGIGTDASLPNLDYIIRLVFQIDSLYVIIGVPNTLYFKKFQTNEIRLDLVCHTSGNVLMGS